MIWLAGQKATRAQVNSGAVRVWLTNWAVAEGKEFWSSEPEVVTNPKVPGFVRAIAN